MYKIPKNLTKYSETFLWGLSFKQFGYVAIAVCAILLIALRLTQFPMSIRILLCVPIAVLAFLLLFLKIDERLFRKYQLKTSLRDVGYYNPKIDSFSAIKEINDDVVFLKSGKLLGIVQVQPLDFFILNEDQQEYVLGMYRNWLRNLNFDVQITSRSVDLDLSGWLNNIQRKPSAKKNTKRFRSFSKWIVTKMEKEKARNRVFYLVIPLLAPIKTKKEPKLKSFMFKLMGITRTGSVNREDPAYKTALKELGERVDTTVEMLEPAGLKLKRLDSSELLGLYSSYFTNTPGGGRAYLTPVMWLNEKK